MTIKLVKTCDACPEQYDAYLGSEKVGYLRLRHGHFRVDCPDCGGEEVYRSTTQGDGCFDGDERDYHLTTACLAIQNWASSRLGKVASPYEIVNDSEILQPAS